MATLHGLLLLANLSYQYRYYNNNHISKVDNKRVL